MLSYNFYQYSVNINPLMFDDGHGDYNRSYERDYDDFDYADYSTDHRDNNYRNFEKKRRKSEKEIIKDSFLLTMKPILYVTNVSENEISEDNEYVKKVREYAKNENAKVIKLCVKIEEELSGLEDDDKKEMLEALGMDESGLDKVIKESYDLLGLMSFLTAGKPEVRAWTIKKGTKAPEAAGKIHSDIQRGFIRAEVVSYDDLIKLGSLNEAKEKGLVRSEGKDYIMQDGDVVLFRFNV